MNVKKRVKIDNLSFPFKITRMDLLLYNHNYDRYNPYLFLFNSLLIVISSVKSIYFRSVVEGAGFLEMQV